MENGILYAGYMSSMCAASTNTGSDSEDFSFMIKLLKEFKMGGTTLNITSTHICLLIVTITLLVVSVIVNRIVKKANASDTPGTIQNIAEMVVEMLNNMVYSSMGKETKRFVNYISTLFIFVLFCNISGLFGLRAPTADYGVTLPLGVITFVMIHYCGIKKNKMKHFADMCKPVLLTPINVIGELAVPISLSLRLFGNIMSGTVLMGLIYMLPRYVTVGIPAVAHVYFDIFSGCIQAYVISMLTMVYITDKIGD